MSNLFAEALHPRGFHGRFSAKLGGDRKASSAGFMRGAARGRMHLATKGPAAKQKAPDMGARARAALEQLGVHAGGGGHPGMSPEERIARSRGKVFEERGPRKYVESPEEARSAARAAGVAHGGHAHPPAPTGEPKPKAPAKKSARALMAAPSKTPAEHVTTLKGMSPEAARQHAEGIKGRELDSVLAHAGLSKSGTAASKRDRLVAHAHGAAPAKAAASKASAPKAPAKSAASKMASARSPVDVQQHADHLAGLSKGLDAHNLTERVTQAKAYVAGVKGKELDALARRYHIIGVPAARKREMIVHATVGGSAQSVHWRDRT